MLERLLDTMSIGQSAPLVDCVESVINHGRYQSYKVASIYSGKYRYSAYVISVVGMTRGNVNWNGSQTVSSSYALVQSPMYQSDDLVAIITCRTLTNSPGAVKKT